MRRFASLRRKADFVALRRHGRRFSTASLTIYRSPGGSEDRLSAVGITVGKTIGKAVVRNRLRRRLAALVDAALRDRAPVRLLVVPRPVAATAAFATLRAELDAAFRC